MPTSPASEPFKTIERSGFFDRDQDKVIAPITPAAAESVVVTKTKDTGPGSADRTDPPLNPYQPNHKRNTPIDARGML